MSGTKNALIIGASRGLGLGLVQRLKEDGWAVTATVRDKNRAEALQACYRVQHKTRPTGLHGRCEARQQDRRVTRAEFLLCS